MTAERELASRRVGEFVMAELRKLDHVGYVRFASVYRAFEDVADFREELDRLERDLPGEGQLPLLGGEVVPHRRSTRERHADKSGAAASMARETRTRPSPPPTTR